MSLICGVAYNDSNYQTFITAKKGGKRVNVWCCPYYNRWLNMVTRCYSKKYQSRQKSYEDCTVCEEWLTFSNFKAWIETQDWEGKALDKDLLVKGNRLYSPDTCIFVDMHVNNLVRGHRDGKYKIGARKSGNKFQSVIRGVPLGTFFTEDGAHCAYLIERAKMLKGLISVSMDQRLNTALTNLLTDVHENINNLFVGMDNHDYGRLILRTEQIRGLK